MEVIETLKDQIALVRWLSYCSKLFLFEYFLFKACTFDPDYFLDPAKYKLKHFVQNTVEFSCLKSSVVLEQLFLQTKTDLSSFIQLNINIFKLPDN